VVFGAGRTCHTVAFVTLGYLYHVANGREHTVRIEGCGRLRAYCVFLEAIADPDHEQHAGRPKRLASHFGSALVAVAGRRWSRSPTGRCKRPARATAASPLATARARDVANATRRIDHSIGDASFLPSVYDGEPAEGRVAGHRYVARNRPRQHQALGLALVRQQSDAGADCLRRSPDPHRLPVGREFAARPLSRTEDAGSEFDVRSRPIIARTRSVALVRVTE
jgi:hypothetical protein